MIDLFHRMVIWLSEFIDRWEKRIPLSASLDRQSNRDGKAIDDWPLASSKREIGLHLIDCKLIINQLGHSDVVLPM